MYQLKKAAATIDVTRNYRRRQDLKRQLAEAKQSEADMREEVVQMHSAYPLQKPDLAYATVYEDSKSTKFTKFKNLGSGVIERFGRDGNEDKGDKLKGDEVEEIHEHNNGLPATNWIFPTRSPRFQEQWEMRRRCAQTQSDFITKLPREVRELILEHVLGYKETYYLYLRAGDITPVKEELGIQGPLERVRRAMMAETWFGYPLPEMLTILLESQRGRPLHREYDPLCIEDIWRPLDRHFEPWGRTVHKLPQPPGILLTCRKVYDEGIPILYGRNKFVLQFSYNVMLMEPLWALERLMEPNALQRIRFLDFTWFLGPLSWFCDQCRAFHDETWRKLGSMTRLRWLRINFDAGRMSAPWRYTPKNCWRWGKEPLRVSENVQWISARVASLKQVEQFEFRFGDGLDGIEDELELTGVSWRVMKEAIHCESWGD